MRVLFSAVTLALVAVATASMLEAAPLLAGPRTAPVAFAAGDRPPADTLRRWSATLAGREGRKVTGVASARGTADGAGTEITVSIEGDTPGATRPWHVHAGSCAKSGGVMGSARAYPPMAIDAKGKGSGTATIAVPLADSASYYVNIHDSAAAMGIIVACGDLQAR